MRGAALQIQMLGRLTVTRGGVAVALPASRKARALVGYLALAPQAVSRSQLCELLWDVPNDPRGELRWCLSKLRGILDTPGRKRVETSGDTVRLDLGDCSVDAAEIGRAVQEGLETVPRERLRALSAAFTGEFLEGLETGRNPNFGAWLAAQRRKFRGLHAALLEQLTKTAAADEARDDLERWLALSPFDLRVHELLLQAFARQGQVREGEEHLAATARLFQAEDIDPAPLRAIWLAARGQPDPVPRVTLTAPSSGPPPGEAAGRRASIAVMPFVERGPEHAAHGGPGGGFAHDLITRLAKLRSLFVIAQGSVFALSERAIGPQEAGRMLNVDYVVGGSLRCQGGRITVTVDLYEARTGRTLWAEVYNHQLGDAFFVLDEIGSRIVASVASEIESNERNRAVLKPPNSLDAWEAHHRGLWHMYRFNKVDNERAAHFFETAIRLDPTFARAHAFLSFTHFQNVFQGWAPRAAEIERAFEAAGQSLMADDRDPAAHWSMGRALWLRGAQDSALGELQQAVDLSPNFALGHYALAFVHSQSGDAQAAVASSDQSRDLSPFDPLLFAMLGARAMALVRLGQFEEAAEWGLKAAARPNAHAHILAISAYSLALAGRVDEARAQMAAIHKQLPDYRIEDFLTAMQFSPEGTALFREGAKRIGLR
ncbi:MULTISPECIES: transcriptional regulator [Rhodomicrobium]|uniref:transcriptional regulator n=1 Tax=Rhodomicrobium TaxID=1068 RepID=UPI000B4B2579|nr:MULTISPECIES: transcriptional regulator [Rhodomicrobium]